jgi:hypothetical protein
MICSLFTPIDSSRGLGEPVVDVLRSVANEVASYGIIAMDTYTPLVCLIVVVVLFDSDKGIPVLDA